MHYRNGREAKNGDTVISLMNTKPTIGVVYDAVPGNDYCNGRLAEIKTSGDNACMVDCIHIDDLLAILKEKGLDKRPAGK